MDKIHFYRKVKQENEDLTYDNPFIPCDSDYIPAYLEPIIIHPYPLLGCFLTGDGGSTCYELFTKKFNNDFTIAQKNFEECQKVVNQFTYIKENELWFLNIKQQKNF